MSGIVVEHDTRVAACRLPRVAVAAAVTGLARGATARGHAAAHAAIAAIFRVVVDAHATGAAGNEAVFANEVATCVHAHGHAVRGCRAASAAPAAMPGVVGGIDARAVTRGPDGAPLLARACVARSTGSPGVLGRAHANVRRNVADPACRATPVGIAGASCEVEGEPRVASDQAQRQEHARERGREPLEAATSGREHSERALEAAVAGARKTRDRGFGAAAATEIDRYQRAAGHRERAAYAEEDARHGLVVVHA